MPKPSRIFLVRRDHPGIRVFATRVQGIFLSFGQFLRAKIFEHGQFPQIPHNQVAAELQIIVIREGM